MSYHVSNLGSFAGSAANPHDPAYFADRDGFVPQAGDPYEMFSRDLPFSMDELHWRDWVASAAEATAHAERRAQEWREETGTPRRTGHAFERTLEMPREGRPPECRVCLRYPNDPVHHQVTS